MILNYLKVAKRFFIKDRIYTIVNLTGFTISVSFALLIILWILNEFSYEKHFDDAKNIFRVIEVQQHNNKLIQKANTYMPLASKLKNSFSIIENATFIKYEGNRALNYDDKNIECKPGFVDDEFLNIFNFEIVEGDTKKIHLDKGKIILTEKVANKFFGSEPALGKVLVNKFYSQTYVFEVIGVVKKPQNTHFSFEVLINIKDLFFWNSLGENGGWSKPENFCTYIKVKDNFTIQPKEKEQLNTFLSRFKDTKSKLWFQPILDIHLYQDFEYLHDNNLSGIRIVLLNLLLALILVAISIFNFINLNLTRSANRYKEIAIRKVIGATNRNLLIQFYLESIFQSVISIYIAIIFAEVLRPVFNLIISDNIIIEYDLKFFIFLLLTGLILGILAGSYPAFFLSRLSPVAIFSQRSPNSFNSRLIRFLSIFQFIITTTILIVGIFINNQLKYVQNKDLGIEKENILVIKTELWYGLETYINEIEEYSGVIAATSVMHSPDNFSWENKKIRWEGMESLEPVSMVQVCADKGFLKTYSIELVEGEFYKTSYSEYWNQGKMVPIVINETAARIIGKEDIIGTKINRYIVIGIVKDFHFKSLHKVIEPLIISYSPEGITQLNIRISPENKTRTINYLKNTYLKHRPEREFHYVFLDDLINQKYKNEKRLSKLLSWFLVFSLIIALSGIVGILTFTLKKRSKEIAIRKVNGASFFDILVLFIKEYSWNLLISFLFSCVLSTLILIRWLRNFAYFQEIGFMTYLIPVLVVSTLTLITLFIIIYFSICKNPVESLRYE